LPALALALLPGTVIAHGEVGDHVAEFQEHLDDYERDVRSLGKQIDRVVERHRAGDDDADEAAQELAHQWEEVKYHAAVEQVASPLYAPIWQALTALREAIQEDRGATTVAKRGQQLKAALHQGLGALKLKAQSAATGQATTEAEHTEEGAHATLRRIRDQLDHAVAEYADGHADDAKSLIQDAYFQNFEGLEGDLIEQDADLVADLEKDFNASLLGLINGGVPAQKVRDKVAEMKDKLERAEGLLEQAEQDRGEVF
jgi:hypothetical protein